MITSSPEMPCDGAIRSDGEAPIYYVRDHPDASRFVLIFDRYEIALNEEQVRDLIIVLNYHEEILYGEKQDAAAFEEQFGTDSENIFVLPAASQGITTSIVPGDAITEKKTP
jgi:hypothetical protein